MPDRGFPSASRGGVLPGDSIASRTTAGPASNENNGPIRIPVAGSSSNDCVKMSEYEAFVDAQAQECYKRLRNEVERASRGA